MGNLNISSGMVQALGTAQAKKLVTEILADNQVDKADSEKLKELKTLLETSAKADDNKVDSDEGTFINSVADYGSFLGIFSTGTNKDVLLANLQSIKEFQDSSDPSALSFDGKAITVDGWLSDEVRVVRLRDRVEPSESTGPATTLQDNAVRQSDPTVGGANTTTQEGQTTVPIDEAPPTPVEETVYTPTNKPEQHLPPPLTSDESVNDQLKPQVTAHNEAVQKLQSDVAKIRDALNDPQQITNDQLRSNMSTLVSKDSGNAVLQLMKLNPNLLDDMKKQGLINSADADNIRVYLESGQTDKIQTINLSGNGNLSDKLSAYLTTKPLTESQLNAYRTELVAKADAYLGNPDQESFKTLSTSFSNNLYVFQNGVSPDLETAYRSMSTNLANVDQKYQILTSQRDVVTGTKRVIGAEYSPITNAQELAQRLGTAPPKEGEDNNSVISTFTGETQNVIDYLKLMTNQYPGQAEDVTALESKLKELKTTKDPQRQLALVNEIKTGLDEVYTKTGIQKGSAAIDLESTKTRLQQIAASSTNPKEQAAASFLAKYPEVLQMGPKISDYSGLLQHLNTKTPLTTQETSLKAALESGNVQAVNSLFFEDLVSGSNTFFGFFPMPFPSPTGLNMTMPGGWNNSANLAQSLGNVNPPERRAEIVQALQSPESYGLTGGVAALTEGIQGSSSLQEIAAQFSITDKARSSIESVASSNYSTTSVAQGQLTGQIQDRLALEQELTTARQEIDALLKDDNVAAPVKEKLKLQQTALNDALAKIKAGTFTGENIPANSPLNSVLTALNKQNTSKNLSIQQQLQLQATLEVLDDMKKDPRGMQKLEAFYKQYGGTENKKEQLTTIFEKDGNNYKFPDQMQAILNDPNLSIESVNLVLNQTNRVLHLADTAETQSTTTLNSFRLKGQEQNNLGKGQGEFFSGFMAVENIDRFLNYQKQNPGTEPSYALNELSKKLPATDPSTLTTTEERRQYRTDVSKVFNQGIKDLQSKVLTDLSESESYTGLTQLFGTDDSQKKALALLNTDIAEIKPLAGSVSSVEDFFKKLSPADIQKLTSQNTKRLQDLQTLITTEQNSLQATTDPKKKQEIEAKIKNYEEEYKLRTNSLSTVLDAQDTQKMSEMSNAANVLRSELTVVKTAAETEVNRLVGELRGKVSDEDLRNIEALKNDPVKLREYLSKMDVSRLDAVTQTNLDMLDFSALTLQQVSYIQNKIDRAEPISAQDRDVVTALRSASDVLKGMSRQFRAKGGGARASAEFRDGVQQLRNVFTRGNVSSTSPGSALSGGTNGALNTGTKSNPDQNTDAPTAPHGGDMGVMTKGVLELTEQLADKGVISEADAAVVDKNATQLNTALLGFNALLDQMGKAGMDDETRYRILGRPPAREQASPPPVTFEDIGESLSGLSETVQNTSDQDLGAVVDAIYESASNNSAAWDQLEAAFDTYLQSMSPILQSMGQPGIDLSTIEDQPGAIREAELSAKTQALIDDADADEANLTLAAMPEVSGGEHFDAWLRDVMKTVGEWSELERQKFVAELAQKMMNEVLRAFYKDRQDEGDKNHTAAIEASKKHATQLQQIYSASRELGSAENSQAVASMSGDGARSADRSAAFNRASNMSPEQQRELTQDLIKYARQGVIFDPKEGVFKKFDPPPVITPMQEKALMAQYDLMIKAAGTPGIEDDIRSTAGIRPIAQQISMN